MPQSAIATGWRTNYSGRKVPRAILDFDRTQPCIQVPKDGEEHTQQGDLILLQNIFRADRARTDRDFSRYKRSTTPPAYCGACNSTT